MDLMDGEMKPPFETSDVQWISKNKGVSNEIN